MVITTFMNAILKNTFSDVNLFAFSFIVFKSRTSESIVGRGYRTVKKSYTFALMSFINPIT